MVITKAGDAVSKRRRFVVADAGQCLPMDEMFHRRHMEALYVRSRWVRFAEQPEFRGREVLGAALERPAAAPEERWVAEDSRDPDGNVLAVWDGTWEDVRTGEADDGPGLDVSKMLDGMIADWDAGSKTESAGRRSCDGAPTPHAALCRQGHTVKVPGGGPSSGNAGGKSDEAGNPSMASPASRRCMADVGGAEGARTPDPKTASLVLSQLSYSPT